MKNSCHSLLSSVYGRIENLYTDKVKMINDRLANIFKVKHVNDFHSYELAEIKTFLGKIALEGFAADRKNIMPRESRQSM